ncbi:MAG: glucosamine-6-phosphate deaminase [Dysgonamonadaceae bacterium]|jgi:glucosamine-6-phosphate deaminase|nr:glucosamine-6-phosphate deaminase [Dysgonamonadaceae bacterium]
MNTNLSSQITLNRVSRHYYEPADAFERSALTRYENIPVDIYESAGEGSIKIAREIAQEIRNKQTAGHFFVLALPGGHSPQTIYQELVRLHKKEKLSFRNVIIFNIFEFYPVVNPQSSNLQFLKSQLLDHIDIDPRNVFSPDGSIEKKDLYEFCRMYEQRIQSLGGIDFMLLGIGHAGNIGFNEPGSSNNSYTRLILLDSDSRKEASRSFISAENVPTSAITMGVSTILSAKKIVLMAWGDNKSKIVKQAVEGKISDAVPASYLQSHSNTKVVIDISAAYDLTRISTPWLVTSCEWDDKMIRRAIVWLCRKLEKPILKLTNKDYSENGLGELLALYKSAYNVNIRIFNDLQHTITGWPGGKPNADDTHRPERATPYPKKIIVFSPHPDDDVISMGGTLKRLVDQDHDVHVAYEVSGNIAVGDDEAVRFLAFLNSMTRKFDPQNKPFTDFYEKSLHFLTKEKKEGDSDSPDVLFLKGRIRRGEARMAGRYIGVKPENIHFLDLPFYETGKIKKGDLTEEDVNIVIKLLQEVKPHQIFVAGDLADPHGTHKVALDAVLAAIDELKTEKWIKNCRIWMYRGAWMEWEIDHIEMAVPISPEELRQKRNAILKHQSQMESAPFMGSDERLFWQRAEDRNKATADLYNALGLAAYEAIEAFVEYKI